MGSKSRSSQPAAPDPAAVAAAQGAANRDAAIATTRLNQIKETTPYGTSDYKPTGVTRDGIEQYERITTLNPQDQAMLDRERQIGGQLLGYGGDLLTRVQQSTADPFDWSTLPPAASLDENARKAVSDSLYGRATSRLDPSWTQDATRLETKLENQGIGRGSEAYSKAMDDFGRQRTDAYEQARMGADAQAVSEQGRLFGMSSTARQNALSERLTERGLPLQELQALLGAAPAIATPQFAQAPTAGIAPADITGATAMRYQGDLSTANANRAASNATAGSLAGLAGSLGGAYILSDPAAKTDRAEVDEASILRSLEGLDIDSWRYKGEGKRRVGPMADDFAEKFGGDGKTIDIPTLFGVSLSAIQALADRVHKLEGR